MTANAREAKKALRKSIKAKCSGLSEDDISRQSHTAQELVLRLPQYKDADRIGVYLSMPKSEAQTNLIVRDALSMGKKLFVPYIHRPQQEAGEAKKRSVIEMLRLHSAEEFEGLERDGWGIPSLPSHGLETRENATGGYGVEDVEADGRESGMVDLVVVPGVAFDESMSRLGHGAGFYDEYLARYCAEGRRKKPSLVGLCLAEQFLTEGSAIPTTEHDWCMDAVAVGDGRLVTLKNA